ncbi:MAG TPA: exo-alpha-sialidase, partial [Verrucomicrobiota bacterium]|nr:exo-alpha-sialidase [Verrucomicrobiota bacterium]
MPRPLLLYALLCGLNVLHGGPASAAPYFASGLIFPPEHWHNHGSSIVETPRGGLLVCWFHGSGERTADDVRILGARRPAGAERWSEPFEMADAPGFPDTNCAMFVDPDGRLWLLWPVILANLWESALMRYRIASDFEGDGPPRWTANELLLVKPGPEFAAAVTHWLPQAEAALAAAAAWPARDREEARRYLDVLRDRATDKGFLRLGWMTRSRPFVLDGRRLIVPLYHDGFSCSLMAVSHDWGAAWRFSPPLLGGGNIQPSIVPRTDGSLYTLMRDNGPPPARLLQSSSHDGGLTWTPVTDSEFPNSGTGAEIIRLHNGHWLLVNNDTETGRHQLTVMISPDEGRTWPWRRHLERDEPIPRGTERGEIA